jgi:hypothetical protein
VLNPFAIPAYGSDAIVSANRKYLVRQVKSAMADLGFSNAVNMVFNAAGMVAGFVGEKELIYYCVDEYTGFTGNSALKDIEEDLFRKSDLVIVSADVLYEKETVQSRNARHSPRH